MAKKGCFAITAAKLVLGVSLDRPEVIKVMAFFTLYDASQIKNLDKNDFNALAEYCAVRIVRQHGDLYYIESNRKEIITQARIDLEKVHLDLKEYPDEWPVDLACFSEDAVKDYKLILARMLEEICANLKIPKVITLDDQKN